MNRGIPQRLMFSVLCCRHVLGDPHVDAPHDVVASHVLEGCGQSWIKRSSIRAVSTSRGLRILPYPLSSAAFERRIDSLGHWDPKRLNRNAAQLF